MPTSLTVVQPLLLKRLSAGLALFAFMAGIVSLSGWVFDIPRLTDWFNDGISILPNTAVLVVIAAAALILLRYGYNRATVGLGTLIGAGGALNLLQFITGVDFGFNHQLLLGRDWGNTGTLIPGCFGPPASVSFILIGISLVVIAEPDKAAHRYAANLCLIVVLMMMFSLLGYLFDARSFYAIPWLSTIALPTSTILMALAVGVIMHVPQHQPMLLLSERSSAGSMARTILPIVILVIPLVTWLRTKGFEYNLFDVGTGRALGAAILMLSIVALMWVALLALRRREQRERETDRRKDEFLATLAHELRNPLAPISNATSMLKLAQGDPVSFARATNMIERQTSQLVRLVDDLLDLSRVNSGKMELRRERILLAAVINQAHETCSAMAESAGQTLTVELPPQPIYLDADPVRLSQVVSNLLHNACKFAGQGGHISLTVSQQNNQIEIKVKDSGIGISADKLAFIFEMFSQVNQSLERVHAGLGIGLTLSKRLVELHSGSIAALSDGLDKGSEFVVRLPISADQTSPLPVLSSAARPDNRSRILIVDDNRDSAESLAEVLKLTGNETFLAHDGEEAVAMAEMQRPDTILLDIGLPKLNGFNVCLKIRESAWASNVLIIAMTGWGQKEDRRKSAEAGFDHHLVKPVNLAALMDLLASRAR